MLRRPKSSHAPRFAPRIPSNGLRSGQGDLVDMSSAGMRLHFEAASDMAVGDVRPFVISSPAQRIKLKGKVVWIKRKSLFSKAHDVGIQFLEVPAHLTRAIEAFAANGFMPTGEPAPGEPAPNDKPKQTAQPKQKPNVDIGVPDLYAMLGLKPGADATEVRRAYHVLAKSMHPDRNPNPTAEEEFANISKAYKVLGDPDARARYDAMLHESDDADAAA